MIHKTAIIDSSAKISANVTIGPYSVIGPNVEIGKGTVVQSHVNIIGNTFIGKNNQIYPFASIGNDPQDLKFKGEKTLLEIGDNNKIREYVTINPGTEGGGGKTKIGVESTVIGMKKNNIIIYRHGGVTKEKLEKKVNEKITIYIINNSYLIC